MKVLKKYQKFTSFLGFLLVYIVTSVLLFSYKYFTSISVTSKPEFGNASTLQGVLDYLANILNGTNTVTNIKAKEIDLVD